MSFSEGAWTWPLTGWQLRKVTTKPSFHGSESYMNHLVIWQFATDNGHRNSESSNEKWWFSCSLCKRLPESTTGYHCVMLHQEMMEVPKMGLQSMDWLHGPSTQGEMARNSLVKPFTCPGNMMDVNKRNSCLQNIWHTTISSFPPWNKTNGGQISTYLIYLLWYSASIYCCSKICNYPQSAGSPMFLMLTPYILPLKAIFFDGENLTL